MLRHQNFTNSIRGLVTKQSLIVTVYLSCFFFKVFSLHVLVIYSLLLMFLPTRCHPKALLTHFIHWLLCCLLHCLFHLLRLSVWLRGLCLLISFCMCVLRWNIKRSLRRTWRDKSPSITLETVCPSNTPRPPQPSPVRWVSKNSTVHQSTFIHTEIQQECCLLFSNILYTNKVH